MYIAIFKKVARRLFYLPYTVILISLLLVSCKPNALSTTAQQNPLLDYNPLLYYSLAIEDLPTAIDSIGFYDRNTRTPGPYFRYAATLVNDPVYGDIGVGQLVDKRNALFIDSVINLYGYPGAAVVGDSLSHVAALVIHHYPSVEFKRKHLPTLLDWLEDDPSHVQLVMGFVDRLYFKERGTYLFMAPESSAEYDESEEGQALRARLIAIDNTRKSN